MNYLLLQRNEEKYWLELNEDNYANRQIILDKNKKYHVSCLEDCLAEGPLSEADLDANISSLTKQEFEYVWKLVLKDYKKRWEDIKKRYPIGTFVQGTSCYSYPQGIVIKGKDFIAIYKGNEPFYINKSVQYKIESYDDINMWLILV